MLTNKGKYGLKALVHLASLSEGQTAQSFEIAKANNIPKKFLDAILGELRVAGMIKTRKGKNGGYMLARPAADIMAGGAIRTLDGPLAPIACASHDLPTLRRLHQHRELLRKAVDDAGPRPVGQAARQHLHRGDALPRLRAGTQLSLRHLSCTPAL